MDVDAIQIAFAEDALAAIQVALAVVMFGVALDLKVDDFKALAKDPRAPAVGLICQFVLLPALTFPLALLIAPTPSMALGMMLVAACPGGNVSNFLTQIGGGRLTVSVGMTAVSTVAAVVSTPLNLSFWGQLNPETAKLFETVSLDPWTMFQKVAVLLLVPVVLGMGMAHFRPSWAARLRPVMKIGSMLFFFAILIGALMGNFDVFVQSIGIVAGPVILLNAMAIALGFGASTLAGLSPAERRAVTFEVGIQNSGLGMVLVFTFFGGLGGMMLVAAFWGIWHLVSGFSLAAFWSRRPL